MILALSQIKKFAIFKNFDWQKSIILANGDVGRFKKINIIYGRNYSGKTTLSRIIRAMETGKIPEKYINPDFAIQLEDHVITPNTLLDHQDEIRVYNKDFIRENLGWLIDDSKDIKSFAVSLGADNQVILNKIKTFEEQLESVNAEFIAKRDAYGRKETAFSLEDKRKDELLRKKAADIKRAALLYNAVNYNINSILNDIAVIHSNPASLLTEEECEQLKLCLKEDALPKIDEIQLLSDRYQSLWHRCNNILIKDIYPAEAIDELLHDTLLQDWVRQGIKLHEGHANCAFCGGALTSEVWAKLSKHFDKRSEEFVNEIDSLILELTDELSRYDNYITITQDRFYNNFKERAQGYLDQWKDLIMIYKDAVGQCIEALRNRQINIYTKHDTVESKIVDFNSCINAINQLIEDNNKYTDSLGAQQQKARQSLRLDCVHRFINDIKLTEINNRLSALSIEKEQLFNEQAEKQSQVQKLQQSIKELHLSLQDENSAATKINTYLTNYFGHNSLALEPYNDNGEHLFIIMRDGEKAHDLSEGECSLIAFCYFLTSLEKNNTINTQPIIWIDDPISSLDSNHIYFLYSLIKSQIVDNNVYGQLFISTHNLEFLKFLKRLGDNRSSKEYFLLNRIGNNSQLRLMPKYLKKYITEFNYLFHQIYKCSQIKLIDDDNYLYLYNFGNNARKFLEIFLYYKYPDDSNDIDKYKLFFGDNPIPSILINRMNNEYSHLTATFERGSMPIEVPEMLTAAQLIIQKIKELDEGQYNALIRSIQND